MERPLFDILSLRHSCIHVHQFWRNLINNDELVIPQDRWLIVGKKHRGFLSRGWFRYRYQEGVWLDSTSRCI